MWRVNWSTWHERWTKTKSESPTGIGPMTSQRSRGHGFNPRHVLRFCLCSTLVSCWSIFTFHKTVLTARKLKARGMRKEIFLLHMPLVFHSPFLLCLFHIFRWLEEIAVLWREKKKIHSVSETSLSESENQTFFSRHWSSWSLEPYKICWVGHFIRLKTSTCLIIVCYLHSGFFTVGGHSFHSKYSFRHCPYQARRCGKGDSYLQ